MENRWKILKTDLKVGFLSPAVEKSVSKGPSSLEAHKDDRYGGPKVHGQTDGFLGDSLQHIWTLQTEELSKFIRFCV